MANAKNQNEEVAKLYAEMAIMMANFSAIKTLNTVETKFPEAKKPSNIATSCEIRLGC